MTIESAIRAVARTKAVADIAVQAWLADEAKLTEIGINNNNRRAMLIGQCAHESGRFVHRFENLNYSADGLWRVFRRHFSSRAECNQFHRQPEKIANRVYSNRMDNGSEASGDGWRYRGRGYLQLTGKANYRAYGNGLGIDLIGNPDLAAEASICWQIAARYCATRKRGGKNLLQWADESDDIMVTKGINGGTHGLQDRIDLTDQALAALTDVSVVSVIEQQRLLVHAGFDPGGIDGLMGPNTQRAINAASVHFGVNPPELWERIRTAI